MDSVVKIPSSASVSAAQGSARSAKTGDSGKKESFETVLKNVNRGNNEVHFSKHAAERAERRGIQLNSQDFDRLGAAVTKARDKGSTNTLIIMDGRAFIVGAKTGTVVTVAAKEDLTSHVFTNIDATVLA